MSRPVMSSDSWLEFLDRHYLRSFLPMGGSAVKFVVTEDTQLKGELPTRVAQSATSAGLIPTFVPSDSVRVHLMEQIFGRVADEMPWDELVTRVLCTSAREHNWRVPDHIDPNSGLAEQLAGENALDSKHVSLVLQRICDEKIFRDRSLARDFRVAMTWLARFRVSGGLQRESAAVMILDWLRGRIGSIANMRNLHISSKITRWNARHHFGSLCTWVRKAQYSGIVVILDLSRVVEFNQRLDDGGIRYGGAALLDAYEVLRQFIDSTDELDGYLLLVVCPPSFLDIESRRGLGRYPALLNRVYDEVRDDRLGNPHTALVRIR